MAESAVSPDWIDMAAAALTAKRTRFKRSVVMDPWKCPACIRSVSRRCLGLKRAPASTPFATGRDANGTGKDRHEARTHHARLPTAWAAHSSQQSTARPRNIPESSTAADADCSRVHARARRDVHGHDSAPATGPAGEWVIAFCLSPSPTCRGSVPRLPVLKFSESGWFPRRI